MSHIHVMTACDICVDSVHVAFMHVYMWNMAWLYVSNIYIMTVHIWHIHVMTGFLHASCHDTKHDILVWWHACHSNNEARAWRWSSLEKSWTCFPTAYSHQVYSAYRLVGLVVRRPPRERKVPGSNPACDGIFSGSSQTSDLKIGTPVATLPGAWRYRVSAGTGRPGVSILWLGEVESWICNFHLSVAARKIVCADPSLRYTSMLLGR